MHRGTIVTLQATWVLYWATLKPKCRICWFKWGTPSFTWTPPSGPTVHTPTLSVIPTGTASLTYTLHYTNSAFSFTTSTQATLYPLPAGDCNNCELVKNGSFELNQHPYAQAMDIAFPYSTGACGTTYSTVPVSDPKGWVSPVYCSSPDYFKTIYPVPPNGIYCVGIPNNYFSTGSPTHNGGSYAGFFTSDLGESPGLNYREYIQQKLKCALVTGQLYNVSFYTSQANWGLSYPPATNNIGAYLSTTTLTTTSYVLNYTPQINANSIITNTVWTQVAGTIVGNGEQYITLGNFFDNAHTLLQNPPANFFTRAILFCR